MIRVAVVTVGNAGCVDFQTSGEIWGRGARLHPGSAESVKPGCYRITETKPKLVSFIPACAERVSDRVQRM